MSEITKPFIHSNGTSVDDLLNDNIEAANAVRDAIGKIQKMEFNGRDYYPVEGSFDKARAERLAHIEAMRAAHDYFMAIAEHCADAQAERESRRSK